MMNDFEVNVKIAMRLPASLSVLNVKDVCARESHMFACPKSRTFVDSLVSSLLSVNFSHAHILTGSVSFSPLPFYHILNGAFT